MRGGPILGDRRDHFEAKTDIWEVAARRSERSILRSLPCGPASSMLPTIRPVAAKRLSTELADHRFMQMLTAAAAADRSLTSARLPGSHASFPAHSKILDDGAMSSETCPFVMNGWFRGCWLQLLR
jgi:hypothetical protein